MNGNGTQAAQAATVQRVVQGGQAHVPATTTTNFMESLGSKMGMDALKLHGTLKNTIFAGATDAQVNALCMVANEYRLNPFLREIYAFPSKDKGIVPVVSIDGWIRIANEHPAFAGYEVNYPPEETWSAHNGSKVCPSWIEVVIYRTDRPRPMPHREYLDECFRNSDPWRQNTKRMLKHKAFIQAVRYALGFGGIYDEDEARSILTAKVVEGTATFPEQAHDDPMEELLNRAMEYAADPSLVREFFDLTVKGNNSTPEAMLPEVLNRFAKFMAAYQKWADAKNGSGAPAEPAQAGAAPDPSQAEPSGQAQAAGQEEQAKRHRATREEVEAYRTETLVMLQDKGVTLEQAEAAANAFYPKWTKANCDFLRKYNFAVNEKLPSPAQDPEQATPPPANTATGDTNFSSLPLAERRRRIGDFLAGNGVIASDIQRAIGKDLNQASPADCDKLVLMCDRINCGESPAVVFA